MKEEIMKEEMITKKSLFNVNGDDSANSQSIINGNSTGICNLNNIRYKWVPKLYTIMLGNHWIPEKVNLQKDKMTIKLLTPEEDDALKKTLSFLIFLDSLQVNNLPNIQEYITDPSVNNLLVIQQFQEVIHSQSYQYILESLYPSFQREEIYNLWREHPLLLKRNSFIAKQYEDFKNKPTKESFFRVLLANFLLESIYFYSGFNYFDQLASRNKVIQTSKVIDYIRRDENTHVALFRNIMKESYDISKYKDIIYEVIDEGVMQEIEWAQDNYGNRIMGISYASSESHLKWLANKRLQTLGLSPLYEGFDNNPYQHLEQKSRENFFEAGAVTEYDRSESIQGWGGF